MKVEELENEMFALYNQLLKHRADRMADAAAVNDYEGKMSAIKSAWTQLRIDSLNETQQAEYNEKRNRLSELFQQIKNREHEYFRDTDKLSNADRPVRIAEITDLKSELEQLKYYCMTPVEKIEEAKAIGNLKRKME